MVQHCMRTPSTAARAVRFGYAYDVRPPAATQLRPVTHCRHVTAQRRPFPGTAAADARMGHHKFERRSERPARRSFRRMGTADAQTRPAAAAAVTAAAAAFPASQ